MGDTLAAYIDQGGGVVLSLFSYSSSCIRGKFYDHNYFAIQPSGWRICTNYPLKIGSLFFPFHPIMYDVNKINLNLNSYYATGILAPGAVKMAEWSNREILAATKIIDGHRRVDLGFYPACSEVDSTNWDASTDAIQLIANSLIWVSQNGKSNWLLLSKNYGYIKPDQQDSIIVQVNKKGMTRDSLHSSNINIYSSDFFSPETSFTVSMLLKSSSYYFELEKITADTLGYPGTTVTYLAAITNSGEETDSYQINYFNNNWSVNLWDTSETKIIDVLNNTHQEIRNILKLKLIFLLMFLFI